MLIEASAEIDRSMKDTSTPLFVASKHGHTKTVHLLVQSGAGIDRAMNNGATPLHIACFQGHSSIVEVLLPVLLVLLVLLVLEAVCEPRELAVSRHVSVCM